LDHGSEIRTSNFKPIRDNFPQPPQRAGPPPWLIVRKNPPPQYVRSKKKIPYEHHEPISFVQRFVDEPLRELPQARGARHCRTRARHAGTPGARAQGLRIADGGRGAQARGAGQAQGAGRRAQGRRAAGAAGQVQGAGCRAPRACEQARIAAGA
jgi:hypothetical protein